MDAIKKLEAISEEMDTHIMRLQERHVQIKERAANGPEPTVQELLDLQAEAFGEMVNTCLDFQREVVVGVAETIAEAVVAPPDVGLEPEDADRFIKVFQEYQAMLESGIANLPPGTPQAMRTEANQKLDEVKACIERVEELTFDDGEPDEDEDDEPEEESAPN